MKYRVFILCVGIVGYGTFSKHFIILVLEGSLSWSSLKKLIQKDWKWGSLALWCDEYVYIIGPNPVCHADGYEKLKPYGFPIHGVIDGFFRRVLWLHVTRSNNNSDVHAYFYINTVKSQKLYREMLRTDCGIEDVLTACVQCFLANSVNAHKNESSSHYLQYLLVFYLQIWCFQGIFRWY